MLPRKIFENSHTVMGFLAFFEQFVAQVLFFCPKLFLHQIAFCSHIFNLCVAKGLFALNAILIRYDVARNFIHFLTQKVGGTISTKLRLQQFCFLSVIL